ncbi:MAG: prolipoprotein diacylglyceryl transferase, partial [Oscillospiraceae bacterium]|nr:prolipoprotein diacylglyceryl transferase [Oscillospiraceae bacterium]
MSHVSFPGLGLEFDINRVAFTVAGFEIYWYGVLIALGMFIGVIIGQKNAKRFGIDEDKLYDVIIWGALGALFGGRSFYVLFSDDYKVTSIRQFLNLREGGTAFYGILTGALVTAFIVCLINKTKFLCVLDDIALGFL